MKLNRIGALILVLAGFSGIHSCEGYLDQFNMEKFSDEMEFTPSIVAPVAYGAFSIQDILESLNDSAGLISLSEDSLILISYADTAYSLKASEVIEIPNHIGAETYIEADINIGAWTALPVGESYTFHKMEKMDFAIEPDDRIDSMNIKAGNLNLQAFSEFKHSGVLEITSKNIIDENGDTLNLTFEISQEDGMFVNNSDYDLADYRLTMDEINDSAVIKVNFNLTLTKSANPVTVGEEAGMIMTFENIEYEAVFGHIAERSVADMSETLELEFFGGIDDLPEIYFADPQLNVAVHNSYGVPLSLDIQTFRARSSYDGSFTDLTFKNDTMNPFLVYAPTVDQLGQTLTTRRNYNVETCNIDDLISSVPDQIDFTFGAKTGNPPGSTEQNFLLDTSEMTLTAEVILPMWLNTSGYTLKDTLDTAIDSLMAQLDFIESISFRLTTLNQWPLEIAAQIYFIDDAYNVVDSLFDEQLALLQAAPVDLNGELDETNLLENIVDVDIFEEDFESLENATGMMLVARAVTTDNGGPTVKFFSKYLLEFKVSIAADFKINTSELNFGDE